MRAAQVNTVSFQSAEKSKFVTSNAAVAICDRIPPTVPPTIYSRIDTGTVTDTELTRTGTGGAVTHSYAAQRASQDASLRVDEARAGRGRGVRRDAEGGVR